MTNHTRAMGGSDSSTVANVKARSVIGLFVHLCMHSIYARFAIDARPEYR